MFCFKKISLALLLGLSIFQIQAMKKPLSLMTKILRLPVIRSIPPIRWTIPAMDKRFDVVFSKQDGRLKNFSSQAPSDKKTFYKSLDVYYVHFKFPLVGAYNDYEKLYDQSEKAYFILEDMLQHPNIDKATKEKVEKFLALFNDDYFKNLKAALIAIKKHPHYLEEIKAKAEEDTADAAERNARANEWNAMANTWNAFNDKNND